MRRTLLLLAVLVPALALSLLLLLPAPGGRTDTQALPPLVSFPVRPRPAPTAVLDLNTATAEQLQALPGIGPVRAAAILAYREAHGPFARVEELAAVSGIGPALVDQLWGLVTVGP